MLQKLTASYSVKNEIVLQEKSCVFSREECWKNMFSLTFTTQTERKKEKGCLILYFTKNESSFIHSKIIISNSFIYFKRE